MKQIGTFLAGLFEDDNGNPSIMRLITFLSFIVGAILAFKGYSNGVVSLFVGSAVGGKLLQKVAER